MTVLQQMTILFQSKKQRLDVLRWERSQLAQQIQTRESLEQLKDYQFQISDLEAELQDCRNWLVNNRPTSADALDEAWREGFKAGVAKRDS
jgi:hypothetical protein